VVLFLYYLITAGTVLDPLIQELCCRSTCMTHVSKGLFKDGFFHGDLFFLLANALFLTHKTEIRLAINILDATSYVLKMLYFQPLKLEIKNELTTVYNDVTRRFCFLS